MFLNLKDSEQNIAEGRNKFQVRDYFKYNVAMKRINIYVTKRAQVEKNCFYKW